MRLIFILLGLVVVGVAVLPHWVVGAVALLLVLWFLSAAAEGIREGVSAAAADSDALRAAIERDFEGRATGANVIPFPTGRRFAFRRKR
jgi:hypothetical protein